MSTIDPNNPLRLTFFIVSVLPVYRYCFYLFDKPYMNYYHGRASKYLWNKLLDNNDGIWYGMFLLYAYFH